MKPASSAILDKGANMLQSDNMLPGANMFQSANIATTSNSLQYTDIGVQVDIQIGNPDKCVRILRKDSLDSHPGSSENSSRDTSADFQITKHQSKPQIRQVGLINVRVGLVSLSERYRITQEGPDNQTDDDFSGQEESIRTGSSHTLQDFQEIGTSVPLQRNAGESSSNSSNGDISSNGQKKKRMEDDREDRNDGNKRVRRMPPGLVEKQKLPRLACPYQAYEKFQSCLKRGRGNPQGGCAGIFRLKQHLNRRHVRSFRCERCWRSFDSRSNRWDHETQQPPCDIREILWDERFMTDEQESEMEKPCRSKSEQDMWWNLFRLLIPAIQDRDMVSLSMEYSPFYIHYDAALMVPAMTFPTLPHQQIQLSQPDLNSSALHDLDFNPSLSTTFDLATPVTSFTTPSTAPSTQGFSMPLLEVSSATMQTIDPDIIYTSTSSGITSVSSNIASPSASSVSTIEQSRMQRNLERLKSSNQQAQRDNAELREANRENRADLHRVDMMLEEILGTEELPSHLYEKLSQVSEALLGAKDRIR
ncbi:hypothetical protein F5B20DRAFT_548377 [Whalleya microplaca]|nr:hypothetical protein F5B20DRAFT_548377 [Whalleya microplaca]